MKPLPVITCLAALCCLFVLSCATSEPLVAEASKEKPIYLEETDTTFWRNVEGDGPFRIEIDLSEQVASFYKGTVLTGQSQVATGKSGNSTPTGSFRITEKVQDKRSNIYGQIFNAEGKIVNASADRKKDSVPAGGKFVGAPMPYWMRLTSYGIGMHVGAIPYPGSPASHGCVRMPEGPARLVFASAKVGTPVTVKP